MSSMHYLKERLQTLYPNFTDHAVVSPLNLLRRISGKQWRFFSLGFFAWTWDAFDFHSVTLSYPDLTATFNRSQSWMTLSVALAMMTRPIGGAFFGILADWYGRKWPFIANCSLLVILELATGFCTTFQQFLAVRTLFGFAMGGIYGNAAATALEDCPPSARGLLSGLYQNGYPLGYILASAFYKAFNGKTKYTWRPLFWFGAVPPIFLIIFRYFLDDTDAFQARGSLGSHGVGGKSIKIEVGLAIREYWQRLLYLALLCTGMVYLSHGTQDIYPQLLRQKYHYSVARSTLIQVVANLGGVLGGICTGYGSQILGRRLSIILMCIVGVALLYPYTYTSGRRVFAAAFFEQFCVQGAWAVIPIHLIELSSVAFRTLIVGTSYQVGVFFGSPCNTIIAEISEHYLLPSTSDGPAGTEYDYGPAICAFTACIFACVILIVAFGPENLEGEMIEVKTDDERPRANTGITLGPI